MASEVRALIPLSIPRSGILRRLNRALRRLGYQPSAVELSVAFVDDRRMKSLNATYRRQPATTDVLSFEGTGDTLGEIIISVPQARRQAKQYGSTLRAEIELLLVHGLLHLAGYDHQRPKDRLRMQRLERELLSGRSLIHRAHGSN